MAKTTPNLEVQKTVSTMSLVDNENLFCLWCVKLHTSKSSIRTRRGTQVAWVAVFAKTIWNIISNFSFYSISLPCPIISVHVHWFLVWMIRLPQWWSTGRILYISMPKSVRISKVCCPEAIKGRFYWIISCAGIITPLMHRSQSLFERVFCKEGEHSNFHQRHEHAEHFKHLSSLDAFVMKQSHKKSIGYSLRSCILVTEYQALTILSWQNLNQISGFIQSKFLHVGMHLNVVQSKNIARPIGWSEIKMLPEAVDLSSSISPSAELLLMKKVRKNNISMMTAPNMYGAPRSWVSLLDKFVH